jgi:hypothetical protein
MSQQLRTTLIQAKKFQPNLRLQLRPVLKILCAACVADVTTSADTKFDWPEVSTTMYPEIYSNLDWAKVRLGEWPIIRLRQVGASVWILVVHNKILQFVILTICELLVRKNKIHRTLHGRKLRVYL